MDKQSRIEELRDAIFSNVEIELVESLPLCNRETEVLFYYDIKEKGGYYFLDEIYYIFYIARIDGQVEEAKVEEIIPEDLKSEIEFSQIPYDSEDDGLEDLEEEYGRLYLWFAELGFKDELNQEEKEKLRRLKQIFEKLVPDSVLRDLYLALGYSMFDYIDTQLAQ